MEADSAEKPRRGRPPGARNKPRPDPTSTPHLARITPPSTNPMLDYKHADPDTILSRQWTMLDWAQQACRNEMQRAMQASGYRIDGKDIEKLERLSNAIVRAIDAMKKSADVADELAKRLTAEQLLEAALKKIEGQDLATIRLIIKRLRNYYETVGQGSAAGISEIQERTTGADAVAALDTE